MDDVRWVLEPITTIQIFKIDTGKVILRTHASTLDWVEAWVRLTRDALHRRDFHDQTEEGNDCIHS